MGIKVFKESDYETIINPLLEILAATGTDYTAFFRALSSFGCSETKYTQTTSYYPEGAHSPEKLRASNPTDCLGIILKSLVNLQDEDRAFLAREVEKRVKERTSQKEASGEVPGENEDGSFLPYDIALEPLGYPSLEETAKTWKCWAHMYRARLVSQLGEKSSPDALQEEDGTRERRLKTINPKYCLRGCIIRNMIKEIEKNYPASPEVHKMETK